MTTAELIERLERADGPTIGYKVEPGFKDIPHHIWWIKGEGGGVQIWARRAPLDGWPTEWIGGVECGEPIAVDLVGQTRYCDDCLAALREPAAEEGRE